MNQNIEFRQKYPIPYTESTNWDGTLNSSEERITSNDVSNTQKQLRNVYKETKYIHHDLSAEYNKPLKSRSLANKQVDLINQLRDLMDTPPSRSSIRSSLRDSNLLKGYQTFVLGTFDSQPNLEKMQKLIRDGYSIQTIRSAPNSYMVRTVLINSRYDKSDDKMINEHFNNECEKHTNAIESVKHTIINLNNEIETALENERMESIENSMSDNDRVLQAVLKGNM